jgi:hypothetical protein
MQLQINIDESSEKGKHLLSLLSELKIHFNTNRLSPKDAAFGMGRAATNDELDDYIQRCMNGTLADIDDLS